ncbi:MAG: WecB/TagA/CpsF family glycosyltransferase [Chloroflexi bacterium]|nr:WecB/TagA/CpsF family glycosyltransferase [Chloroflexota bacterium]
MAEQLAESFPARASVAGIEVSLTTYASATRNIVQAAQAGRSALVAATSVHGVTQGAIEPGFRRVLNDFDILTPDGQPVRWALNLLHGAALNERVYGPTLMLRVCEAAAARGLPIYLYGGRPDVLDRLVVRLRERMPALRIAGSCAPPFRALSADEDAAEVADILERGSRIVFVALGCPRQERWAHAHRDRLPMPLVCVGAAFDFHAGALRQAPAWMQAHGLEWLFRLLMEPRRLFGRYATAIPLYLVLIARDYLSLRARRAPVPARR